MHSLIPSDIAWKTKASFELNKLKKQTTIQQFFHFNSFMNKYFNDETCTVNLFSKVKNNLFGPQQSTKIFYFYFFLFSIRNSINFENFTRKYQNFLYFFCPCFWAQNSLLLVDTLRVVRIIWFFASDLVLGPGFKKK